MTLISELKEQWMKNPAFKAEYDALEDEFSLARELIEARTRAGLSQAELASAWAPHNPLLPAWKVARPRRPCEPLRVSPPLPAAVP